MQSKSSQWQSDKLHAAQLLSVSGQTFLESLPAMLVYWLHSSLHADSCSYSEEELAFELLRTVSSTSTKLDLGNDVSILKTLPAILRTVNSIPSNTLRMRYEQAKALLGPDPTTESSIHTADVAQVDQLLIPALLGGSIPLRVSHAQEVRKHILRDDDVSATKLVAVYSTKTDGEFAARLPGGFVLDAVIQRLTAATFDTETQQALFGAMKVMGCIGETVFQEDERSPAFPSGFKQYKGKSLALEYALAVDQELEAPTDKL